MSGLIRVSIQGDLPGGEVWSVNPCFTSTEDLPASYEDLITIATAINAISVPAGLLATMNSNCHVTGVRLESRSLSGDLVAVYEAPRGTVQTGSGTSVHPFQTALVLSLRTANAGASGRGRLYWPATGVALTPSTMRVTNSVLTSFRTDAASYLTSIKGAIDVTVPVSQLVVWSRLNSIGYAVNRISAGDVPDVQRRRRDSLAEVVVTASYP